MTTITRLLRGVIRLFRRPDDDFGDRLLADLGLKR